MAELMLKMLQQQIAEKKLLDAKCKELMAQRKTVSERCKALEKTMHSEQADVDRLEGRSLAAAFYQLLGKIDQKLDEERQQAYAARVKYDAAARELSSIEIDLSAVQSRAQALEGCEQRYQQALEERISALKTEKSEAAQQLLESDAKIEAWKAERQELKEAVAAGKKALATVEEILEHLEEAEGYGYWDVFSNGVIPDLMKHSELDDAQEKIEQLQIELHRFKTELADVEIQADIQVTVNGFLKFADFFFDGLFADWAVVDRIETAQKQVEGTKKQIKKVLSMLKKMQQQIEEKLDAENAKREQWALESEE